MGGGRTEVRQWRKPSETVWPARVAMMEEDWPEARSASAKSVATTGAGACVRSARRGEEGRGGGG